MITEIEHGIYVRSSKGIMLIPFNDSSEYKVYYIQDSEIKWWYKSEDENNIRESIMNWRNNDN